ncbi:VOC family protein [Pseudomonas sp. NA-150]|uniref:VOC family protein n=1 Tax=Pseudomonas sp. NA-150 TaxID=3367525 RepID=UPI0037C7B13B
MNNLEKAFGATNDSLLLLTQRWQQRSFKIMSLTPQRIFLMKFASTRLIAGDINTLVSFYEMVTATKAQWLSPQFAEIITPSATLAIGSAETVALFSAGSAEPASNRTAILKFIVDDVDADFERLQGKVDLVHEPKLMPWGNRCLQFRDPEGTIVGLFTPFTDFAKARFGSR